MASLFLGKISSVYDNHEIHAFTKNLPFREFRESEIADSDLYWKMLQGRFEVLKRGQPIYCIAVNSDPYKQIEENPHDSREGTVHFVALNSQKRIACSLSVAIDIGQKEHNERIGVPLENRWRRNGYPVGSDLNPFIEKYLRLNYGENREVNPWEMAELYRHYKLIKKPGDVIPRLGVYIGAYHLLVREAMNKNLMPTWLWFFDAIPQYFNLYRYAGIALLRDFTISNPIRWISPNKKFVDKSDSSILRDLPTWINFYCYPHYYF